jgi:hypothetical protein
MGRRAVFIGLQPAASPVLEQSVPATFGAQSLHLKVHAFGAASATGSHQGNTFLGRTPPQRASPMSEHFWHRVCTPAGNGNGNGRPNGEGYGVWGGNGNGRASQRPAGGGCVWGGGGC